MALIDLLLRHGAEIESPMDSRRPGSPLCHVASYGDSNIVQLLLKAGANVNAASKQGSALHVAARNGHDKVVATLLNAGADPCALDDDGMTPLEYTAAHEEALSILERYKARGTVD